MKPSHIGIIMDGNGRWASQRGLPRTVGHLEGVKTLRKIVSAASALSIPYLTFYAFSTENWKRPNQEVTYLMNLLATRLYGELVFYQEHNLKIRFKGNLSALSHSVRTAIEKTLEATSEHTGTTCVLAINYGGQDEIVRACNVLLRENTGKPITENDISQHLDTPDIPPVDIIVRTGGEKRLSNFLLWESAYAELVFYDTLWPDWNAANLQEVCDEYARRTRRFGGI